ncbi:MAG: hypothetical protein KGL39_40415 [Patescibacteria group bacterium]|nr:hypothetical protein [Patescibacteria group bacterium]
MTRTKTARARKTTKPTEPRRSWAIVQAPDPETGEVWDHIMPVVHVDGFATAKEAWEFLQRVEAAGPPGEPPCLTDDDDHIIATFFGHTLRASCPCQPTVGGIDGGILTHHQAN